MGGVFEKPWVVRVTSCLTRTLEGISPSVVQEPSPRGQDKAPAEEGSAFCHRLLLPTVQVTGVPQRMERKGADVSPKGDSM